MVRTSESVLAQLYTPLPRQADEQLLAAIARKESLAFEILYNRYAQQVYSLTLRIIRNRALAEELLQETFWQVWCSAGSYRGSGAVAAWLLRIARNRALDALRRQKVRGLPSEHHVSTTDPVTVAPSTLQTHLDQREVRQALAALPEEQRICLELSYFDGFSQREIAGQLDIAIGTVKSRMRLALEKLEHSLRSQGYS